MKTKMHPMHSSQGRWRGADYVLLLLLSLCLLPSFAYAQGIEQVRGVVYRDDNRNKQRDEGEPGIARVMVSNGRDIVRTDAQGRYQIPLAAADDSMVFVIKPRDYALPVDSEFIPRFWYQHDPDGSPSRRYAGAPASGPVPDTVNFGLIAQQEPERFTVAMLADPQVTDEDEVDYYRRSVINSLQAHKDDIALGFSLGDIVNDNLDLYPNIIRETAAVQVPWFNVFGNHDMNLDATDDLGSDDTFESFFGPTTYALQYGPVHFIYFDDVVHWLDAQGDDRYHGGLRDDQLVFIANYLNAIQKHEMVVLLMHIPLVDREMGSAIGDEDLQRLMNLLSPFKNSVSISGHVHMQQHFYLDQRNGWQGEQAHYHFNLGAASGSWWSGQLDADGIPLTTMRDGTPNGYALIEFSARDYRINYHAARSNEKLRIMGPGPVVKDSFPLSDVYVNVFNGEPNDAVEYQVDGGRWQPMQRREEKDPFVLQQNLTRLFGLNQANNHRLSHALPSTHLWKANVGTDYLPGSHQLRIRHTDRYGRVSEQSAQFDVIELEPVH
jgi:hypothetical protein